MKLYHYTKLRNLVGIWHSRSLKFNDSHKTNDIFERHKISCLDGAKVPTYGKGNVKDIRDLFISNFYKHLFDYRQISLTQDYLDGTKGYASPMMWGQYAREWNKDKGCWENGVCIELDALKLDFENILHSNVTYTTNLKLIKMNGYDFTSQGAIDSFIRSNQTDLFFTKHKHWEYESEYRLLSNCVEEMPIDSSVTGIYVLSYDQKVINEVERIVGDASLIKLLVFSEKNGLSLSTLIQSSLKEQRLLNERNKKGFSLNELLS